MKGDQTNDTEVNKFLNISEWILAWSPTDQTKLGILILFFVRIKYAMFHSS